MRKVTTINLNNNAYQIDEEGFDALRSYLDNAARALAGNPDRDEILADLEQAIADKCRMTLGAHKTVVSVEEIDRILNEMGPVASGNDDASAGAAGAGDNAGNTGSRPASGPDWRARRLYRIREGQKVGGICQGLAAFAGIDVTLVRVAVTLITIFTGFFPGIFTYIVLCFVLPTAETPEEIAAAHGQPFRAQEVVDRVKKKHAEWRNAHRDERRMRRDARRAQRAAWWAPQPPPAPPGPTARVTGGILLPVLTVLSAAWFAAMAIVAYVSWHYWYRTGFHTWPPGSWHDHDHIPRWIALVAILAVWALLAIPLKAGRRAALYYANGGQRHGWADAWSGLLWIAVVAVILLGAWFALPQLRELLQFHLAAPGAITV